MENAFGKNLKRLRILKGLTLKDLSLKIGVKFQSVGKWEDGTTMPNGKRLTMIAEILGVSINELHYEFHNVKDPKDKLIEEQQQKIFMLNEQLMAYIAKENQELKAEREGVTP